MKRFFFRGGREGGREGWVRDYMVNIPSLKGYDMIKDMIIKRLVHVDLM